MLLFSVEHSLECGYLVLNYSIPVIVTMLVRPKLITLFGIRKNFLHRSFI